VIQYPEVSPDPRFGAPVHIFDKLDGSNIRAEWTPKTNELLKFGARKRLLDKSDELLGKSIDLIRNKYEQQLCDIAKKWYRDKNRVTFFFEFFGPNSFAGNHEPEDAHDIVLLDVHVYKQGLLDPRLFLKRFGKLHIPKLFAQTRANTPFIELVKSNQLEGMTFEGVICKGGLDKKRKPVLFKIKSQAWLDKLKNYCHNDERMYKQLV